MRFKLNNTFLSISFNKILFISFRDENKIQNMKVLKFTIFYGNRQGVGEITEEQRKRKRMREKDELNVGEEDKKNGLVQWGICSDKSCLRSFDREHLLPRKVLVFVAVMPIRLF